MAVFKSYAYISLMALWGLILIAPPAVQAQAGREGKNEVLNNYIEFLNASVHGLHVAHVMMEGYNKVVNEYVDINSHELIQISNKDLPTNIFGGSDAELFFYVKSDTPEALAQKAVVESRALEPGLASRLNNHVSELTDILGEINQIRFDVESFIQTYDLNDRDAIYKVYEILERAEQLYNDYASLHYSMAEILYSEDNVPDDQLVKAMRSVHTTMKIIYRSLRRSEDKNSKRNFNQLSTHYRNYNTIAAGYNLSSRMMQFHTDIQENLDTITRELTSYELYDEIPLRYKGYGKYYAYHNHLLKFTNTTGPGFFRHMNELMDMMGYNTLHLDDEPIIYKVLYPMKKDEIEGLADTERSGVSRNLPAPESRAIRFSEEKIVAEGNYVDIEVYDHQMVDRDSISLQFNGEWVLENFALSSMPKKIRLELKENEGNVLVLHAVNLGIIPPNTVALAYRFKGQRKRILLKSDLDVSEAVKIELAGEGY